MAKKNPPNRGSWLMAEELLERGDPGFVSELRRINEADRLGTFAAKWLADPRPASRALLLQYLGLPFNAFRHEALLKRLFKLAEKQNDDPVMAKFLVGADRLIRRVRRTRYRYESATREQWTEETLGIPRGTMLPKDPRALRYRDPDSGDMMVSSSVEKQNRMRLFSIHTRHYLRRRVWRYFRTIGKTEPQRYIPAIVDALSQYTDEDVRDGIALLDNWGLMHALFHHSPALLAKSNGWTIAEGHTLAELIPTPIFESLWRAAAAPVISLMKEARCRPVRQAAIHMLRQYHPDALARLPLGELLTLVVHEDIELSELAVQALRRSAALPLLQADDWLKLIDTANPQTLSVLSELMEKYLASNSVTLEQTVRLACSRPIPVARLGLRWLRARTFSSAVDCQALLQLCDAQCQPVRTEILTWIRSVLSHSPYFSTDWVLEMLDSAHDDVRKAGWSWFVAEPRASHDVTLWQRQLESPYDDIKFQLIRLLEGQISLKNPEAVDRSRLAPELIRFLWASVLLNVHRGSRTKPRVIGQILERLKRRPNEAPELLPLLAVSLRSIRGPEWRAGLTGVVQLIDSQPELEALVFQTFPELKLVVTETVHG
ncbi:MAG: hypothetical protein JWM11_3099 [Planctomycetaceae bacterium]|nr:hypothetical protein [Planctomycetaceae bacterium]